MVAAKPFEARQLEARARARSQHRRVYTVVARRRYRMHSATEAGVWHVLDRTRDGFCCDCKGFQYTGVCVHLGELERRAEREGWADEFRVTRTAFAPPVA